MTTDVALQSQLKTFRADFERLREEIGRVVVGQCEAIDGVLTALVAGGHVLLEGSPGLGKTSLVRALSDATELTFRRIQFTPDLMPADVIGTYVVMESGGRRKFEFQQGPIFANLLLADEINRTTPKTQSAMLEAMQEYGVTVGNETYDLPEPFFVVATQSPEGGEGTFPLPEKQLDRFLLKLEMKFPDAAELETMLERTTESAQPAVRSVLSAARIAEMSQLVRQVALDSEARRYAARLVLATHPEQDPAPPQARRYLRTGASPRGAQALVMVAKVQAALAGRERATCDDVRRLAVAALAHRVALNFDGHADQVSPAAIVRELLDHVVP